MKYGLFVIYVIFWLILAENLNIDRIAIGALICIGVFIFNKDLLSKHNIYKKSKDLLISNIKYAVLYILILIKEIFKSNFHVAKIVLSPKLNISPTIVTITTNLKSDFDKTILANSITLTPGTLTLDMTEDKIIIHCLEEKSIKDLQNSCFENILLKKEELNNG
ncbi:multicomponent Na+:H+ antiporter subunit E [Clostridium pascui]|uniref:Na+/H+ antiporter subunit E n=1 Tax=Clostridium pascui TaxID=46609 RepID=UPI00195C3EBF|nr:Na+/H+ antiporter subunit E [Clostridium pascui]MBM7869084.1 multicomponent Na+:H+ antiporter subunit E [Clostridium pascui]